VTAKHAAIVKSIRLANIKGQTVNISLYFNRPDANGKNRRRLLTPEGMGVASGSTYIDDSELTLEPGDKLQLKVNSANAIQYVISGVERDLS